MRITRISGPVDFSRHADVARQDAFELARRFDAAVHLVNVVEAPLAELQISLVRNAATRLRGSSIRRSSDVMLASAFVRSSVRRSATCAIVLCNTRAATGCRSA